MPSIQELKLCPKLILVPPRMERYREISLKIHEIFKQYTDIIEPLSLDEAYLDVSNSLHRQGSATLMAADIREEIKTKLQLPASAGVAPLKFLAKIASAINKPDNQFVITPENMSDFTEKIPLKAIPGVGKVTNQKLEQLNLFTCSDIQQFNLNQLIQLFGKQGQQIWNYSHGIDKRKVKADRIRKSIGTETTFIENIKTLAEAEIALDQLYQKLLSRMTKYFQPEDFLISRKLSVKIKLDNYQIITVEKLKPYLDIQFFKELLHEIWFNKSVSSIRLLGIQVKIAEPQSNLQYHLWE